MIIKTLIRRERTASWSMNCLEVPEMMRPMWTCIRPLSTALFSTRPLSTRTSQTPTSTPPSPPPTYLSSPSTPHHRLLTITTDTTTTHLPAPLSSLRSSMAGVADTTLCLCLDHRVWAVKRAACPGAPMITSRGSGRGTESKKMI